MLFMQRWGLYGCANLIPRIESGFLEKVYHYIEEHTHEYVDTLRRFCRQPSISSEGIGMQEMAEILKEEMERIGIKTTIHQTD
jgi:hypothetical protein